MREEIRRAIANAVLPRAAEAERPVFSTTAREWTSMSFTEGGFFDHGLDAHVVRTPAGLYHHGLDAHITLTVTGKEFTGYDHSAGHHFRGKVELRSAVLHDNGEDAFFIYKL